MGKVAPWTTEAVYIDVGSGSGKTSVHAAIAYECRAFGIEV